MSYNPRSMEHYQIISRRYRPHAFDSIVGQEAIVTTLKNALRFQKLAQAYLFCGCRGTGKTTLARLFAKALNCAHLTENYEPCNECASCKEISSGRSLDVLEIDGASNRGIDDIRQINETVGYATAGGKYKIYIIDEVHMLTKEAFNALLKTLEEPPANVKFFFATTEPHKVPPTIISRCQRFDLHRIPQELISNKLLRIAQELKIQIEEEAIHLISSLAEGSLRDAESLFDQVICYAEGKISYEMVVSTLGLTSRTIFFQLDQAIYTGNLPFAFELAGQLFSSGKEISYFMEGLMEHFRLILLCKTHPEGVLSVSLSSQEKKRYQETAALYTEEHSLHILDFLLHWTEQLAKFSFKRVGLEMILLHLIRSRSRHSLDTLIKRLSELEQKIGCDRPESGNLDHTKASALKSAPISNEPPREPLHRPKSNYQADRSIDREFPAQPSEPISQSSFEEPLPKLANLTPSPNFATKIPEPHPQEEKLLQAIKNKIASAEQAPLISQEEPQQPVPQKEQNKTTSPHPSKYETLIRFAAVELEGAVKR